MTMEFLDGETLTARLGRGFLSHSEALPIAMQLCAGLAEAHRKHVIHGDLKSSNVILATDGSGHVRAVITDFGLARRPDASFQTMQSGDMLGTPDYMAPELWEGGRASVASEVYALGVILREMVCGKAPDAKWDRVVKRCLSQDPAARYHNVEEVARALAPRPKRLFLSSAVATLLALMSGLITYRTATAPSETIRLAMLPLQFTGDTLSRDVAARLSRLKGSAKTALAVVPFSETLRHRVDTVDRARLLLGATHVVHGFVRQENGRLLVRAYLTDARSNTHKREWTGEYAVTESR
jgi:hypothetical protein